MRILFVDDAPSYGGAQVAAVNMATLMAVELGHELHFLAPKSNKRLIRRLGSSSSVCVHSDGYSARPVFILSHLIYLWRLPFIIRSLRRINADLVIINMSGLEFGWLYIYATSFLRSKRICWLHNPFEYAKLIESVGWRKTINELRDRVGNIWAHIIVHDLHIVSSSSRGYLLKRLGLKNGIRVWSNVFPQLATLPIKPDLQGFFNEQFSTIAVVPGRIDFGPKGQNKLVPLLAALAQHGIALVFVGDGGDLPVLREMCSGHDNVVFTGWSDDVDGYLRAADVVLLPSQYESQPLILMEVLRQNAPVVISSIAAFGEILDSRFVDTFENASDLIVTIEKVRAFSSQQLSDIYDAALDEFSPLKAKIGVAEVLERY